MPKNATHVRMVNKATGQEWDSPIGYVDRAREKGFELVDGEDVPAPEGQYDPSAHTVDEVTAYLATASTEEHDRVLAAERAGKNRTTVTGD